MTDVDAPEVRRRISSGRIAVYASLIAVGCLFILPFIWMVSTSVKPNDQIFVYPPVWIPKPILWSNYADALTAIPFFLYFRNTLLISGLTVLGTILSSTLTAYGFARVQWIGRDTVFIIVLATMMLPSATTLFPSTSFSGSWGGWERSTH